MSENQKPPSNFTPDERQVLHSLAEMFSEKDCRDELRQIVREGATVRELIMAYRTRNRLVKSLQTVGGLIILVGGTVAAIRSLGFWPAPK